MELRSRVRPCAKGRGPGWRACQLARAGWQADHLVVVLRPRTGRNGRVLRFDRQPADLGRGRRLEPAAERQRERLAAEAEAEDRDIRLDRATHRLDLAVDPRRRAVTGAV